MIFTVRFIPLNLSNTKVVKFLSSKSFHTYILLDAEAKPSSKCACMQLQCGNWLKLL
jgi:hypothetical protein